jgi:hypothetical protein
MKKKPPKERKPIANKPNVAHKDKSKYDRKVSKEEKEKCLDELAKEAQELGLYDD